MKSCIVFSVDDGFLEPFQVALYSLVKHNPWVKVVPIFLVFDHATLSDSSREFLKKKVFTRYGLNVDMIDCCDFLPDNLDVFNYQHVSRATFYRLFIARMLDQSFDQAVYLDSDILIAGDISLLYNQVLTMPVAAIKNYAASEEIRLFGPSGGSYFNAGIIVFNLQVLREKNMQEAYLTLITTEPEKLLCWDQDVLNLIHKNDWEQLPWMYNVTRHMLESFRIINNNFYRKLNITDIRIIHFDGPSKPWEPYSYREFSKLWRNNYLQLSGKTHNSDIISYRFIRFLIRFKKGLSFFVKSLFK
jgi:lipopolysaccharide biosynthesis glycosyltransferase